MSTAENKVLVQRYYDEVVNQGNVALIDDLFTPEHAEGQKSFATRTLQALSESHVTIEDLIAEGDRVVSRITWRTVHTGVWDLEMSGLSLAIPPTGKQLRAEHFLTMWTIEGGKLAHTWSSWNLLDFLQQFGVLPAPEQAGS